MFKLYSKKWRPIPVERIPLKLKKDMELKFFGATTLTYFKKNVDEVRLFTLDLSKKEWLDDNKNSNLNAKYIGKFEIPNTRGRSTVYVYDMPRLYDLNKKNFKIATAVSNSIENFKKGEYPDKRTFTYMIKRLEKRGTPDCKKAAELVRNMRDHFSKATFKDWKWDATENNFMQTKSGKIILIDPVIDNVLIKN